MSRQKREQRISAQREAKALEKKKQMRGPSGLSKYAQKKEAQKHGHRPKVTDQLKPVSAEERRRILYPEFNEPIKVSSVATANSNLWRESPFYIR